MSILRIAAFADADRGGNPAGVVITDTYPDDSEMQRIAAEVGYSETAFATPEGVDGQGRPRFRVRYFAPKIEVPFCGHATIALGAALGERFGPGAFALAIPDGEITVEAAPGPEGGWRASLTSPRSWSEITGRQLLQRTLAKAEKDLPPDHLALAPPLAELAESVFFCDRAFQGLGDGQGDFGVRHAVINVALAYGDDPAEQDVL